MVFILPRSRCKPILPWCFLVRSFDFTTVCPLIIWSFGSRTILSRLIFFKSTCLLVCKFVFLFWFQITTIVCLLSIPLVRFVTFPTSPSVFIMGHTEAVDQVASGASTAAELSTTPDNPFGLVNSDFVQIREDARTRIGTLAKTLFWTSCENEWMIQINHSKAPSIPFSPNSMTMKCKSFFSVVYKL